MSLNILKLTLVPISVMSLSVCGDCRGQRLQMLLVLGVVIGDCEVPNVGAGT